MGLICNVRQVKEGGPRNLFKMREGQPVLVEDNSQVTRSPTGGQSNTIQRGNAYMNYAGLSGGTSLFLLLSVFSFRSRLQTETRSAPVSLVYCEKHNLKVVANPFHVGAVMGVWPPAMRAQKKTGGDSIIWGERKKKRRASALRYGGGFRK